LNKNNEFYWRDFPEEGDGIEGLENGLDIELHFLEYFMVVFMFVDLDN
jgi:hypothetical protein